MLSLDLDATVLQSIDELFLLPACKVAMPRAYWLLDNTPPRRILSSQVMLIQPSAGEFLRVQERVKLATPDEDATEIMNDLYLDSAMVLPHKEYALLSAEFRKTKQNHHQTYLVGSRGVDPHAAYLGSDTEVWDPVKAYNEAKIVHFSDLLAPKPWVRLTESVSEEFQPDCVVRYDGREDCVERLMWNYLYNDFWTRREVSRISLKVR